MSHGRHAVITQSGPKATSRDVTTYHAALARFSATKSLLLRSNLRGYSNFITWNLSLTGVDEQLDNCCNAFSQQFPRRTFEAEPITFNFYSTVLHFITPPYRTLVWNGILVAAFALSGYRSDRREILHDGTYRSRTDLLSPSVGGHPRIPKSEILGLKFGHLTSNVSKTVSRSVTRQLNISSTRAFENVSHGAVAPPPGGAHPCTVGLWFVSCRRICLVYILPQCLLFFGVDCLFLPLACGNVLLP